MNLITLKVQLGPVTEAGPIEVNLPEEIFRKLELQAQTARIPVNTFIERKFREAFAQIVPPTKRF